MPVPLQRETLKRGRELPTAAIIDVLFILWFSEVELGVDVKLILGRRAVLAEAFAHCSACEPYCRLDKLHCGRHAVRCEDTCPSVGWPNPFQTFDTLLVLPEGVAFWEFAIMSAHTMLGCSAT